MTQAKVMRAEFFRIINKDTFSSLGFLQAWSSGVNTLQSIKAHRRMWRGASTRLRKQDWEDLEF